MELDIIIEDPRWDALDLTALAARASDGVATAVALPQGAEVAVLACDDARIALLNAEFRAKPTPTNVLSWPSTDVAPHPDTGTPPPVNDPELGDIAISYDTCVAEAAAQAKDIADHVTHLLVHGILHVLGYDHTNDKEARVMEGLEVEILAKLSISNPYEHTDAFR